MQQPLFYQGLFWVPLPRSNEFLIYDHKKTVNISDDSEYILEPSNGFPSSSEGTISIAFDKSGDAWIGTYAGLRFYLMQ
jgi:hypothetical protein